MAERLLGEMQWLSSTGFAAHMRPNRTSFGSVLFDKPGIFECDLHDEGVRSVLPCMAALFEESKGELIEAFKLHLDPLLDKEEEDEVPGCRAERVMLCDPGDSQARTVKLQYNTGTGGCFPCHYDNPGPTSRRALTFILYLNHAWEPGHGGELTLFPFLAARPVRLAPRFNRLVVFKSNCMLHRVERCLSPRGRFCLTIWLDGLDTNTPNKTQLRLDAATVDDPAALDRAVALLRASPLQRSVSRAVYEREYEASLRECMHSDEGSCPAGLAEMLAQHRAHCEAVEKSPALHRLVRALRERKAAVEAQARAEGRAYDDV